MLTGAYNFRHIVYSTDQNGNITRSSALYGTIGFDGAGNYTLSGQLSDSQISGGTPQAYQVTGTYIIQSNGLGVIDSPLFTGDQETGLVSQGVFVGSDTEGQVNDVFVAIPAGVTAASNATFQGNYWVAYMNLPSSDPSQSRDAFFPLSVDGAGSVTGTIVATGYIGASGSAITQTIQSASYSFSSGTGTLGLTTVGLTSQSLISGNMLFYVSPDGNFAVGGSSSGYDMFVAVRAASGPFTNTLFSGLYYMAGLDQDNTTVTTTGGFLDTYYGAVSANGAGTKIAHERFAPFDAYAYDWTYDSFYDLTQNNDGTYDRPAFKYGVGASGLGFVGIGKGPVEALVLGVKAPNFAGPGVYLNPAGVVNAASSAPFTNSISRGELITLYGTNLAASTVVAPSLPFPTSLGGTQVTVNGRFAPIYFVSPTQVSVIVPYATEAGGNDFLAQVQVTNNHSASNPVTVFIADDSPGVFSTPPGGVGAGAVLHADYSVVSAAKPATRFETLLVYVTGLGDVTPAVTEGNPAPSNPLSYTTNTFNVYIDTEPATVTFSGLAPGLAGVYQLNVVVPAAAGSGDVYLDVESAVAYTSLVTIRVQ
jgi:uncharacterized protein (TIGR03437 family)